MKKEKLYISDLDGTLLDDYARLSEFSLNNLNCMIDKGLNFTIATARSIVSAGSILKGLNLRLPIIEINGALISDLFEKKHHKINNIHKSTVQDIYQLLVSFGCSPFISSFDGKADNLYYERVVNGGMEWFLNDGSEDHTKRIRYTDNISRAFDEQVVCITVIDKYEVLNSVADILDRDFSEMLQNHFFQNRYSPDWFWLTIHHHRANKAYAVPELAQMCGFDLADCVLFGDERNDIEMMQLNSRGAYSIAVDNAVDEVKGLANQVIQSNSDDAVVKYLMKEFLYEN